MTGNDYLYGDAGNNTFDGGAGNDTLQGGAGNDTYLFNLGGGQDTIYDCDYTAGNVDTVRFGVGIAVSDITFARSGNDLVLGINGTTDQVKIQNWGSGDAYHIERVEFADGSVWDAAYLQAQALAAPIVGTTGNDTLYGDAGNNTFDGGVGNDTLQGRAGNDTYLFNLGGGQDTIYDGDSTAGNVDTIRFGAGVAASDITLARSGNDLVLSINGTTDQVKIQNWGYGDYYRIERVEFADGSVWDKAYLQDQISAMPIVGTNGNDYLYGDSGSNTLDGAAGNDYLIGGYGNDTYLFNLGGGQDTINDYDYTAGNVDTIRFGAGIAASDITFTRSGMDLVLGINGTTDQLTIQNWGYGDTCRIERVEFGDGMVWNAAQIQSLMPAVSDITGTDGNDTLSAWVGESATLQGLGGDDYLYGNVGHDILDGGTGNDYLEGGTGNDTYLFNLGGGQDTISDYDYTAGNVDTIRFGAGIATSDITMTRSGMDLVLGINGTTDQLTIQNWGYGNDYHIERVEFADGTAWDMAQIQAQVPAANTLISTDGNDTLSAWVGENANLQGMGGDDELYGNDGNDTLDGGAGNDYLEGGAGNDTYLFNLGGGQDTIYEYDYTAGNVDTIRFGAGIAASDITFTRSDTDLVLSINGTTDQVTIQGWGYDASNRIERVEFADGTVWDAAYIQAQTSSTDIIGSDGSDYLYGDGWNNNISGGAGNDYLVGGSGNDTYLFSRGFGQDVLYEEDYTVGNVDQVIFASDILPSEVLVSCTLTGDLILSVSGTNDTLTVSSWLISDANKIEKINFADGTVWGVDDLANMLATTPTEADDIIAGTAGSDILNALGGNDGVFGGAGDDVLMGGSGDDVLYGGSGSDLLYGGDGVDSLYADSYYTDIGNDLLDGGGGDDYIDSSVANDLIIGGAGTDYIYDENGKDVLLFNRGDGQDTYDLYTQNSSLPAQRTISLGGGISYSDLAFSINGTSLVLELGNADSMTFDWWFDAAEYKTIKTLQVIAETMPGYDPNSTDALLKKGIQQFDFIGLFNQFEAAFTADPTITSWQLAPHLSDYYFGGSDTQALGGAMAYEYGKFGTLSGLSDAEISSQLNDVSFGVNNQSIEFNNAPVVSVALTDQISTQGQLFEFAVPAGAFTDINQGDVLTYAATLADGSVLPSWLAFDIATQTFIGTPGNADVGSLNVVVTATDVGGLGVSSAFTLNVANMNDAPIVANAIADQTSQQDSAFSFTVPVNTFTDIDQGDMLTYTATLADGSALPSWLAFDAATQTFSGTPNASDVRALDLKLTAIDTGSLSATTNFVINMLSYNADGSYITYVSDGQGKLIATNFDATGNQLSDFWIKADGSQGVDAGGNHLVLGGNGADVVSGSADNELFAGRLGNDTINTGDGADIIAFNRGDGMDVVNGGIGTDNTITLGNGINYADIALSKVNNDLILEVGNGDQVMFANWYDTAASYKSVIDLQVMADAMAAFDPTSADPLLNQAVQNFDFTAVVNAFDQARGTSATFMHWSATSDLLAAHLSGSDASALGGDLAHQYGTNGSLTGMNLTAAQTALNDPQFGGAAQTLHPLQGLQGGAVTL